MKNNWKSFFHGRKCLLNLKKVKKLRKKKKDGDELCYLPIYGLRDDVTDNWILGKVLMEQYYSVFDLSPNSEEGDRIKIKIGLKNP